MINEKFLINVVKKFECKNKLPIDKEQLKKNAIFRILSTDLQEFYLLTNGLKAENLTILPFRDSINIKDTWDSIEKANHPSESKYSLPNELLKDYVIFAQLEGLNAVMLSKKDHSIWYEDDTGYHQTDLNLEEFIIGILGEK